MRGKRKLSLASSTEVTRAMSQAQIAEYQSLREEHLKNMEMRGTLTNIMVAALAAIIGFGS